MNRIFNLILTALEWLVPVLGITRLGARRIVSVILATAAHLLPLVGCAFLGWDPVALLMAYWIELALVMMLLLTVMMPIAVSRFAAARKGVPAPDPDNDPPTLFRDWHVAAVFLVIWIMFFAAQLGINLHILGSIAKSHYGLASAAAALERLARSFLPPAGGPLAFFTSESASLALMVTSGLVTLFFQFEDKGGMNARKGAYVFVVKPLVRLMAMVFILGSAEGFGTDRLPALATVSVMALVMVVIDQRIELIDHDFGPGGRGVSGFETPHGALLCFGAQMFLFILSASFLVSSFFADHQYDRIVKNPASAIGVIVRSRAPDDEGQTIHGGYWWFVDVEYGAGRNPERRFILHDVKVHLFTASEPNGGTIKVIYQADDPRNAFADVPEDRGRPRNMLYAGIILLILGIAWWFYIGGPFNPFWKRRPQGQL